MRKKKTPRAKLKNYLDNLWSKLTKQINDPWCAWCGKTNGLQSDHVINRWKYPTRWRLEVAIILCTGCHLFRKKRDPLGWAELVQKKFGEDRMNFLKEMAKSNEKVDLEQVKRYLENAANEIKPPIIGGKA